MDQTLFIVGINHRSAAVALRERLAFADDEIVPALDRLRESCHAVSEAALISTCNRVEVVGVATDPARAADETLKFLAADRSVAHDEFSPAVYSFAGRDAARHLFRVGASLDSMVVGEPQILGQLKLAYAQASEARSVGLILHRAFHKAFTVAKRVRKGTLIGHGSVSVSTAAVALAGQIFDTLKDKTVMLMGAGKMAELTARQLSALGIESMLITSRTFDRAVALARDLGGTAVPYDNYKPYLKMVDVLIGSVASTKPILGPDEFEPVIRERRYRPMFLIDMGVPRNFDERLNALQNVYLYDIDDLGALVQRSIGDREREAEKAEQIVELELESFLKWLAGLDLTPTIKDIRYSVERLRDDELGRARGWLAQLEPAERERVELLTRGLTNKLLHRILSGLKQRDDKTLDAAFTAEVARRLLGAEFDAQDDALDDADNDDDDRTSSDRSCYCPPSRCGKGLGVRFSDAAKNPNRLASQQTGARASGDRARFADHEIPRHRNRNRRNSHQRRQDDLGVARRRWRQGPLHKGARTGARRSHDRRGGPFDERSSRDSAANSFAWRRCSNARIPPTSSSRPTARRCRRCPRARGSARRRRAGAFRR